MLGRLIQLSLWMVWTCFLINKRPPYLKFNLGLGKTSLSFFLYYCCLSLLGPRGLDHDCYSLKVLKLSSWCGLLIEAINLNYCSLWQSSFEEKSNESRFQTPKDKIMHAYLIIKFFGDYMPLFGHSRLLISSTTIMFETLQTNILMQP